MAVIGESLTNHPNLEILKGTEEEVLFMLRQIRLPFKVLSMTAMGSRLVLLISLTQPIKKKIKKEE